ncbi:hypothetical protein [Desulfovibrio ferrophilus]|uniref:Orotidine 5'-phosphate decarboxylase n=1 Tax=Desulfovibrio ferrophilus TaxID=241368 RepID=A0A2Z6AVK4_9BACT|nr:hypothetical protein [Desulfovibrio ferrophilus]BBD07267.1 orotidine 5'-phosphate decarboxylase [Desulfovibrio ferrophilus]
MNSRQTKHISIAHRHGVRADILLIWPLLLLSLFFSATPALAQTSYKTLVTPDYKHLLILHSQGQGSASVEGVNQGLSFVLNKNDFRVLRRVEHMDMGGNASARYLELLEELLTIKYQGAQFDGIITSGIPALNMAARLKSRLFPDTVLIAAGIDISGSLPEDMSGIHIVTDEPPHALTLRMALKHHPGTKRILVINRPATGAPEVGTALSLELGNLSEQYKIRFIPNTDLNGMEIALSGAGAKDVVYLADYARTQDNGLDLSYRDMRRLAYTCKVPIYTSRAQFMGTGVLGGYLSSWSEQGKRSAWLLLGHWRGQYIRKIDTSPNTAVRIQFDHNALKRFGITPAEQSGKPQVINQPETTLDTIRKIMDIRYVGAVFFLLIILMVLINRRRIRETKKRLAKSKNK